MEQLSDTQVQLLQMFKYYFLVSGPVIDGLIIYKAHNDKVITSFAGASFLLSLLSIYCAFFKKSIFVPISIITLLVQLIAISLFTRKIVEDKENKYGAKNILITIYVLLLPQIIFNVIASSMFFKFYMLNREMIKYVVISKK